MKEDVGVVIRTGLRFSLLIALSLLVASCENGHCPLANSDPEVGYVVSGTLKDNQQAQLPEDIRVLIFWVVSATSPDYTYVFGEGTIDAENMTFEIVLGSDPPVEALNSEALGVGIILVTADVDLKEGIVPQDYDYYENTLGAAGQYGIIFTNNKTADFEGWPEQFPEGYGVGKGVKVPGTFDAFEPVDPSSVEIIIDDLDNIELVNWT